DLHLLAAVHVAVDAAADAHAARGDVALDAALAADADAALDVDLPLELAVDHEVARAVHLPHDLGAGSDVGRRRAHDGSRLLAIALGNRWRSGRRVAGNGGGSRRAGARGFAFTAEDRHGLLRNRAGVAGVRR